MVNGIEDGAIYPNNVRLITKLTPSMSCLHASTIDFNTAVLHDCCPIGALLSAWPKCASISVMCRLCPVKLKLHLFIHDRPYSMNTNLKGRISGSNMVGNLACPLKLVH